MLSKLFYFIVLIGVLIFIHESGHFLFAKLFKVKVLKFSLGFGPRLIGFRRGETEYCISWFPLGGYVKMLGEDPTEEIAPQDRGRAFGDKPLIQRFLIVFAGPLFNLLLPILIYFTYYMSQTELLPSSVGTVLVGMPAWEQGIRPGDRIVAINGAPVRYWEEVQESISKHPGNPITLAVERRGEMLPEPVKITPKAVSIPNQLNFEETVGQIGVTPDYQGTQIGVSDPESPAGRAGLRTWDEIVAVDGKKVQRWTELEAALFSGEQKEHKLTVLRPQRFGAKFADVHALEPLPVKLKPEPKAAPLEAILSGIAGQIQRAGEALGKAIAGEDRKVSTSALAPIGRDVASTLGLSQSVDLVRRYLPGPAALVDRAASALGRAFESPSQGLADALRRTAVGVSDALADLGDVFHRRVEWPLLRALSSWLGHYAFLGLEPAEFYVFEVQPGSPAQAIGLERGDRVVSLNGNGLTLWREIDQVRMERPTAELQLAFVHEGHLVERRFHQEKKVVVDEYKNEIERYVFGAKNFTVPVTDEKVENQSRFTRAVKRAVYKTGEVVAMMAIGLVRLIQGKISFKTVGGPIMIFDIAGKAAKKGWESFLWIMALISINLGLLNLLPIPVLDGGHLLFIGIEAVKRKPVSLRAREIASLVGFSLLILLMIFAFKNDIERYWKDIVDAFR
jgi:RIP metalloprotease RseP